MVMTASPLWFAAKVTLLIIGSSVVSAQILKPRQPLEFLLDVRQIGLPFNAEFIFCEPIHCPKRSIKHLTPTPIMPAALAAPPTLPTTKVLAVKIEPVTSVKKITKKRSKRKKSTRQYKCHSIPLKESLSHESKTTEYAR